MANLLKRTLTQKQLQQLQQLLDTHEDAPTIAYLHGFITAIVSAPEMIPPSAWFEYFDLEFNDIEQVQSIFTLLLTFYNSIIDALEHKNFKPIYNVQKNSLGTMKETSEWAKGYLHAGINFCGWDDLHDDSLIAVFLHPLATLAMDKNQLEDVMEDDEDADELKLSSLQHLDEVVQAIYLISREIGENDNAHTVLPAKTHHRKTGRNEPCPCGSGLKYKKCCLQEDAAVH